MKYSSAVLKHPRCSLVTSPLQFAYRTITVEGEK